MLWWKPDVAARESNDPSWSSSSWASSARASLSEGGISRGADGVPSSCAGSTAGCWSAVTPAWGSTTCGRGGGSGGSSATGIGAGPEPGRLASGERFGASASATPGTAIAATTSTATAARQPVSLLARRTAGSMAGDRTVRRTYTPEAALSFSWDNSLLMKCGSPKEGAVLAGRGAIATLLAVLLVAAPASARGERVAPSERVQAQLLPPSPQAHGAAHRRAIPRRPRDSAALRTAKQRGAFGAMGPSLPLAPTTTFGGLNQAGLAATDNTAANQGTPPDTTGAIGPNHYVEFVNSKIRVFNSASLSAVSSADLDTFVGKSGDSVFDPQIQWDAQAGRWLYVADDVPNSGNFLVFGFSKTSDPSDLVNGWCRYSVSTGNDFNDYPKLGHNDNNMIFWANVFGPVSFKNAAVWTAPKPAVGSTTCPASVAATSFSLGSGVFTPVPANTSDGSANGYVVAANDPGSGTASHIGAWHVSGPASAPTVTSDGSMTVSSYSVPANVPQPGSTDVIDSSDARLTQAVARADPDVAGAEAVWTQHTVAGTGGRSVVRWYELLPASLTVRQQGTIQDASNFDFNGAISPSGTGNEAVINYNVGSAAQLVQIRAQSRTGSAALGTMSSETTLGTSAAIDQDFSCPSVDSTQTSCRWGDYAGASPDP